MLGQGAPQRAGTRSRRVQVARRQGQLHTRRREGSHAYQLHCRTGFPLHGLGTVLLLPHGAVLAGAFLRASLCHEQEHSRRTARSSSDATLWWTRRSSMPSQALSE